MAEKILQFSRKFSSTRKLGASLSEPLAETSNDHGNAQLKLWKTMFFFVCCPALLLGFLKLQFEEKPKRPEFVNYSHLRIRKKTYPWRDGVKTLFHNPHLNALPTGYEDVQEHH